MKKEGCDILRDYFCGWYLKCQSNEHTLAVIPAFHISKNKRSCSIQIITDTSAWNVNFPYENLSLKNGSLDISINNSHFSSERISLFINTPALSVSGTLHFGKFMPIRYDIMGPFRYVPFMECRHSVVSMKHTVNGNLNINGKAYSFDNAVGYIEGDRGYSFPKQYIWTQCIFDNGSLMLSVADIPFGLFSFTGIIGIIHINEKEYRFATYLGAKAVKIEKGEIIIKQGDMTLSVNLSEQNSQPLRAPMRGSMNRTIHESASCRVKYSFRKKDQTIIELESANASFEYEYPHFAELPKMGSQNEYQV